MTSTKHLVSGILVCSVFLVLHKSSILRVNTVRVTEGPEDRPKSMNTSHVMDGEKEKLNVLFMMMDGFRTELGAYMHLIKEQPWLNVKVKTPNLDKLASEGMLFERAFAQFGRCSSSRSSMFVGRRPDSTHVHDMDSWVRDVAGENLITLPQYFRQNGYRTYGLGKSFCPSRHKENDRWKSWDVMKKSPTQEPNNFSWIAYPESKRREEPLWDDILLDQVTEAINEQTNQTKPFFLFAGFRKPHLPLIVPEEYFKYYPVTDMKRAVNDYSPNDTLRSHPGYHKMEELFYYRDMEHFRKGWRFNSTLPDEEAISLRRAYYASVTYIDHQIGEIMNILQASGLKNDTIVVFAADHGVHLGENGLWGKNSNFEVSTRIPLMVTIPGITKPNTKSRNFVELVDIFPTLIEAARLSPVPMCPRDSSGWAFCTEGVSLLPLLTGEENVPWKNRVYWQGRWVYNQTTYKAYSVRTDEYRYTEYVEHTHGAPKEWPSTPFASELYHKALDPGENSNLWRNENYTNVIRGLSEKLHKGWISALPGA